MLDLKTVLVVSLAIASLQAVAWLFVWLAWRHLYELKFLAVGFKAIAIGLLLLLLREEQPAVWSIVLSNTVIKLGVVLLAAGLARFLGQPRYLWAGLSLLICYVAIWSVAMVADPGNIAIRIYTSTLFTVIAMSAMTLVLLRDRTQPWLLRWMTIGVLVYYMAASIIHSAIEFWFPAIPQGITVINDRNAWYLLQGILFQIALFACLLFMVSSRLSADLREKNDALSREVLERRKLQDQLNTSLESERALRAEQTDFMRVVSHEFRTPLAVIRNAVDMIGLVGDRSHEATRERLSGIGEAVDRLFSLIDRFMTNDRENGFQPESMPIASLIVDVQLHFEMGGRSDRLHFRTDHEAISIFVDPDMMSTIIINLIDNALKYSPERQPVHIDFWAGGGFVTIRVRDRGIGIPKAELPRIGRRFFRASNTKAATGTGLGLYSSRKLLAYHGGTLELLPNEGRGTVAILRVPLPNDATQPTKP
ncbi:two-component sensor histidine kinase [Halomonas cupida]|uniref:histidine kinase n=1 Tax=Halomonas cupida TaxID=44933 RepID=A0A1M7I9T0_9GAMM|nr:HAMP domain-containing sensor histidine kinase [Halomonas cupida]GEN24087.1 two-component sensor histidine kinase [Halomonas cupida]SHM37566.1 Signal transduction histidine kinase [Halomonas cupida]